MLPFNTEKQNLLMHVLHDLHQGLGWGDQYFRFGRIQENAVKKAAKIQILNNRVSVAAGLHEVSAYASHHVQMPSFHACFISPACKHVLVAAESSGVGRAVHVG